MTDTSCRVSIIVPMFNASRYLNDSLGAIRRSIYSDYELIAVDDCSTDDSLEIANRFADKVLSTRINRGPAMARSLGAEASSGSLLFFLDADVRVHPDTLGRVVEFMDVHREYAAVFGSYDDRPAQKGFFSQYRNLFHHYVHQTAGSEASTFWAGCGAVRKVEFESVGGYSERYSKASIEDVELGYRLKKSGRKIRLEKNIQVTHLKRWTLFDMIVTDIANRAIPWSELSLRWDLPYDLNFKIADRLSGLSASLLFLNLALVYVWRPAAFIALVCGCLLLIINRKLYVFFGRKRGVRFILASVWCHWLYFFYSSVTFGICTVYFRLRTCLLKRKRGSDGDLKT